MSSTLVRWLSLLLVACAGNDGLRPVPEPVAGPVRRARVVDEHGQPVAGAELAFLPAMADVAFGDLARDCERTFAAAPRVRSGDDGVVALPTLAACVVATARRGERFGAGELRFDDRSVAMPELGIAPDRHVTVHVRDAAGQPRAGVPVEVRIPAYRWLHFREWNVEKLGASDGEGRLTLWHVQRLLTWDPLHPSIELRARVVGAETAFVPVDLSAPRSEPIVLPCPPHGRLEVQRWLAPGIADGSEVSLSAWLVGSDHDGARPPQAFGDLAAPTGPWRSWPVVLGQQWRVQETHSSLDVVGPVRDGETVRADHVLAKPNPYGEQRVPVVAVLERPDGSPCRDASIVLGDVLQAQTGGLHRVRTDARGRTQFVMRHGSEVEFAVVGENLSAHRPLPPGVPAAGVVDLGTVRLEAPRTLGTGRCVDAETGLPVRAEISAPDCWSPWKTGVDGTFTLLDSPWTSRSTAGDGPLLVRPDWSWNVWCFGLRALSQPLRAGSTNVELRFARTRMLRGTLLVDAEIGELALDVQVVGPDGQQWFKGRGRQRAGRLEYGWQVPDDARDLATARLEIASRDDASPLAVVAGAAFRPSRDGFDMELDLRGELVEYDVFTDGLEDMPGQGYWYVRTRGEPRWRRLDLLRRASFVARRGSEVEAVFAPYRRPWSVRALTTTTMRWRPGSASRLTIAWDAPELPGTEVGAVVLLRQLADRTLASIVDDSTDACLEREHAWPLSAEAMADVRQHWLAGHVVRDGAAQSVCVWQLGHYVVVPYVATPRGPHLFVDAAIPFEVVRAGSEVQVTLRLDAAALRAAVEAK